MLYFVDCSNHFVTNRKQTLEKTEGEIKNWQSRDTGYTRCRTNKR